MATSNAARCDLSYINVSFVQVITHIRDILLSLASPSPSASEASRGYINVAHERNEARQYRHAQSS